MNELHIDHLLLRYDSTLGDPARLQLLVERALALVAAGVEPPPHAANPDAPVAVDLRAPDDVVARRLADALTLKLELGG